MSVTMPAAERNQQLKQQAVQYHEQQAYDKARQIMEKLSGRAKKYPEVWFLLSAVHGLLNIPEKAEYYARKTIALAPGFPEAHFNLANLYKLEKHYDDAISHYKKAIKYQPDYVKAYNNLGLVYQNINQHENALKSLKHAENLSPKDPEILHNLAVSFKNLGQYDNAINYLQKSYDFGLAGPEFYNNMALIHQEMGEKQRAEFFFDSGLLKFPCNETLNLHYANYLKDILEYQPAISQYHKVIQNNPENIPALINQAACYRYLGQVKCAIENYQRILKLQPDNNEARFSLGVIHLSQGNLTQGWELYTCRESPKHPYSNNIKNLALKDLTGKNILLTREQGIGDELFFLRYAPRLLDLVTSLDYLVTPKIAPLVKQQEFLANVLENERDIDRNYDLTISVGDLPYLFKSEEEYYPPSLSLKPDSRLEAEVEKCLKDAGPPPYYGITWRAGQQVEKLLFKQMPVEKLWETVKDLPGTILILQRNPTSEEIEKLGALKTDQNVIDMSTYNENIPKLLALLNLLHEYIGVSNTNVHLRQALGKPSHVFVEFPAEWRWMIQGNESPWFPGCSIYRQLPNKNWAQAVSHCKKELSGRYEYLS